MCVHVPIVQLMKKSNPVWELDSRLVELGSSLEKIKVLLEQRSPTVNEAQRALKVCSALLLYLYVNLIKNLLIYKFNI